jgi:hypothetical protein
MSIQKYRKACNFITYTCTGYKIYNFQHLTRVMGFGLGNLTEKDHLGNVDEYGRTLQ